MAKITKGVVDKAMASTKDSYIWDGILKGFGLKITPTSRKVYLVQYRAAGRTRRVTIGLHGTLTAEQARKQAKVLLGQVASGVDPARKRDKKKDTRSMKSLLAEFSDTHINAKLKRRTAEEYERSLRLHVPENLTRLPVREIERSQISKLHHELRDIPFQANHTLAVLSKFFNWCEKQGYRKDGSNPCRHIEKFPTPHRERFLSQAELVRLGEALLEAEQRDLASPWAIGAIRLLMLTGARKKEILTLRWDWVNWEQGCINLPDSKTGAKSIYLNPPALKVLTELPRLENNPYVICGAINGAHLVNLQKPWARVRTLAGLNDVRVHDLRHTFASIAVAGGMSLPLIGALLGQSQQQTTARYAHLSNDPLTAANDSIGERIVQLTSGKTAKRLDFS